MNPRRIEIAGDVGWASLGCAVPLFLLGAGVLAFPPAGVWGTGLLGLIFVSLGLWAGLWRERLILDADAGVVTSWQGLLRPRQVRSWPLNAFERVAIHCWRHGMPATIDQVSNVLPLSFPIQLEGPRDTLQLEFAVDYARGRARAEELARLLGLPLLDDCVASPVERAGTAPAPVPVLPPGSRLRTHRELDRLVFDLPARRIDWRVALRMVVAGLTPLVFLVLAILAPRLPARSDEDALFGERMCWVLFWLTLPMGVLPPLYALTRRERVTVTPELFGVEWRGWIGAGARRAAPSEVRDLVIQAAGSETLRFFRVPGLVLAAIAGDTAIELGSGLARAELLWLRYELAQALDLARAHAPPTAEHAVVERKSEEAQSPHEPRKPWRPVMPKWRG